MQPDHSSSTTDGRRVDLAIEGMTCGHCVAAVTDALRQVPGVAVSGVGLGVASVTLDARAVSTDAVVSAIQAAGYDARVIGDPLPGAAGTTCCSPRPS